jgi:cell division transport system permease protein
MPNDKQQRTLPSLRRQYLTPGAYINQHFQAFFEGFQKLSHKPLASLLTILVISIALLLPSGLLVFLNNVKSLTGNWQRSTAISVYLYPQISQQQATDLMSTIQARDDVKQVNYISPDQGLKSFEQQTGSTEVMQILKTNPLPGVIDVTPSIHDPLALAQLQSYLQSLPAVDQVQLDMQWVKRLNGIISLAGKVVYSIMILLAAGVLLIIGNTIRLSVQQYQLEISVIKLAGGSNAYIRRPFLYSGILYGFTAGIIAWLLLDFFVDWMSAPVAKLASLYGSQFQLQGLNFEETLILLIGSLVLGFIGSWIVVGSHLTDVEPEY